MNDDIFVRPEDARDIAAIREVNERAFERADEARLVDALRKANAMTASLVAEVDGRIVGHVLFSPVHIDRGGERDMAVGLGPMAVVPEAQRRGIGTALVHAGIERMREAGHGAIVVLGHPSYYPRLGFAPARHFGLRWEVPGHDDAFFAMELRAGFLGARVGVVRYRAEFMQV
ncbi:MAG: N-acetyltransferase [Polyangiaceae bacterium]|nr:N-acetyltransferase [Polyangiaceae bacterium]